MMNKNKFDQYNRRGAIMTGNGWIGKNDDFHHHVKIDWLPVIMAVGIIIVVVVMVG